MQLCFNLIKQHTVIPGVHLGTALRKVCHYVAKRTIFFANIEQKCIKLFIFEKRLQVFSIVPLLFAQARITYGKRGLIFPNSFKTLMQIFSSHS